MKVKTKNSAAIMLTALFIALVLCIFLWVFLYKGVQQDKTYSGAKFIDHRIADNFIG